MFWNVLKQTASDLKSRQNLGKVTVKGFIFSKVEGFSPATLIKMNFFADIFQGFYLDFKNTFFIELLSVASSVTFSF